MRKAHSPYQAWIDLYVASKFTFYLQTKPTLFLFLPPIVYLAIDIVPLVQIHPISVL